MERLLPRLRAVIELLIAVLLAGMVVLTFADVIGRRLFGAPIYGAHDITEHLMALVVFTGLPIVTLAGAHLTIDLFDRILMRPELALWRALIAVAVAAVLALTAWLFFRHAGNASAIAEVSQALRLPRAPLYYYMSLCSALAALAALDGARRALSGRDAVLPPARTETPA